ncbi:STM4015 family protein [Actinoallomurus rhizosphaericola]|uniref:STM4015 family protein n=1 Tax=Actinoallomurus rhizosphaericola TaxID=2952536 RepID=UPI002092ABEB|nr:STM4015 family protein [Actinoallomurus rhizosphaericola]MCO5999046.1 STM4015 family protein [Actinoallomurus rhizosphaericola]
MFIDDHLSEFDGLPVVDLLLAEEAGKPLPPAASAAWRIGTAFEEASFDEVLGRFLEQVDTAQVTSLIIGYWGASYDSGEVDPVDLLVKAADRLPNLRALFLGDIEAEEAEISWIEQSDITPLFTAFPGLRRLEVRGGNGLAMDPIKSEALTVLRMESGGLPADVVRAVAASDLPNLEHLDLWLGVENYGGNANVADLAPILSGERLPALRRLGLEDSEIQDEIAAAVASAPVVARLESLSLAMGILTDEGAEALLSGQPLTHLKRLDLHHHFLSDRMVERVRAALPGVEVDLSEQEKAEDDERYVAVDE